MKRVPPRALRPALAGFALPELLVATVLSVLLAGAVLAVVHPSNDAFLRMPAVGDLHQRLRAAAEVLTSRVQGACAAWPAGPRNPLGVEVPCLFPYGLGTRRLGAPGPWSPASLSILAGLPSAVPATLGAELGPGDVTAELDAARCPAASPACGIRAGDGLALVGPGGCWELARAGLVEASRVTLERGGPAAGRPFPAGSHVIPVDPVVFYLRGATGADPPQLRQSDAAGSDLPLLDHVVFLGVQLFGESDPPAAGADAAAVPAYGPRPAPAGVDDPRDAWGAGENCVFSRVDGVAVPRLPALGGNPLGLVELAPGMMTDGPWCPDAASPSRFDADLLRVRRVRVLLRLEAGSSQLRARGALFFRPGHSTSGARLVPDRELSLDIVPRGAGGGR